MDPGSLFSIITFFTFLFFIIQLLKRFPRQNSAIKLPPGPWKLPFIGSLHHLTGNLLPHRALSQLAKKHGPVMHLKLGQFSTVIISSPRMAKEVMKTHDLRFASRPDTLAFKIMFYDQADIGFAPYGDYWRQMRKICIQELLSEKCVRSFSSIREEEVSSLIKSVKASSGSPINLTEKFFSVTSYIICSIAFGKKFRDQEMLLRLMCQEIALAGGFAFEDMFPSLKFLHGAFGVKAKLEKLHQRVDEILDKIIGEHKEGRAQKGEGCDEDIVDVLLRLQEDGGFDFPITHTNIKAIIYDIFAAGVETSSTTMDWAMAEMMKNPKVMEKAQAELRSILKENKEIDETAIKASGYLKSIFKETLRLHPPTPLLLPRECLEQCEIGGYTIPTKTKVFVNAWVNGRDPKSWKDAECFIPERFENSSIEFTGNNFELIPFGAGRRICPGIPLALANMELPLAKLLYHFNWKLTDQMKPEDLDMGEAAGSAVGRRNSLCLIATPYEPSFFVG